MPNAQRYNCYLLNRQKGDLLLTFTPIPPSTHTHTQRERERERETNTQTEKERHTRRERESERKGGRHTDTHTHTTKLIYVKECFSCLRLLNIIRPKTKNEKQNNFFLSFLTVTDTSIV